MIDIAEFTQRVILKEFSSWLFHAQLLSHEIEKSDIDFINYYSDIAISLVKKYPAKTTKISVPIGTTLQELEELLKRKKIDYSNIVYLFITSTHSEIKKIYDSPKDTVPHEIYKSASKIIDLLQDELDNSIKDDSKEEDLQLFTDV